MVVLGGVDVSYERGTPVLATNFPATFAVICVCFIRGLFYNEGRDLPRDASGTALILPGHELKAQGPSRTCNESKEKEEEEEREYFLALTK